MKRVIFPLISFLLVVFIVLNLDFGKIAQFLRKAPGALLMVAFVFYVFTFVLRAFRWKLMLYEVPFGKLFSVVAIHTMANNLYPARTGELSFIYLLGGLGRERLFSVLLLARFMDILCIGVIFSFSVLFLTVDKAYWLLFPLTVVFSAVLVAFLFVAEKFIPERGFLGGVKLFFLNTKEALLSLKNYVPAVFAASLLIWIVKYIAFYFLTLSVFKSFGLAVSFWQAVFGVSFSELTTVLPIHSVGGYGTFEAGWTGAYVILGFSRKVAVTSGFLFHTLLLLFSIILGLPFLVLYKFHK